MDNAQIKETHKVVGEKILVKPIPVEEEKIETVTASGLILDQRTAAEILQEKNAGKPLIDSYRAEVIAIGPDVKITQEGDIVTLPEQAVHPALAIDEEVYKIVREPDILIIETKK